jgi:hypothetical protein
MTYQWCCSEGEGIISDTRLAEEGGQEVKGFGSRAPVLAVGQRYRRPASGAQQYAKRSGTGKKTMVRHGPTK